MIALGTPEGRLLLITYADDSLANEAQHAKGIRTIFPHTSGDRSDAHSQDRHCVACSMLAHQCWLLRVSAAAGNGCTPNASWRRLVSCCWHAARCKQLCHVQVHSGRRYGGCAPVGSGRLLSDSARVCRASRDSAVGQHRPPCLSAVRRPLPVHLRPHPRHPGRPRQACCIVNLPMIACRYRALACSCVPRLPCSLC